MGWILMQPADDEESVHTTKILLETGECLFNLTQGGARLHPTGFGSRYCLPKETKYYYFEGEAACGWWTISQNRRFLLGTHFYWLCDCKAIKEILDYNGLISMMYRWAQELLGYFSCLHRCAKMMIDVDGLSERFGKIVAEHLCVAALLHKYDILKCPDTYNEDFNRLDGAISNTPTPSASDIKIPILTSNSIASCHPEYITTSSLVLVPIQSTAASPAHDTIHLVPILLHYSPKR